MDFLIPVISEVNIWLLFFAVVSSVFYFFWIKVKFSGNATVKGYGILIYSFVFYTVSAISFVFLNAMDNFFRLQNDLYGSLIWFGPVVLLSSLTGAACGWLVYFTAEKIAPPYVYRLMNFTLLLITPTLVYSLLVSQYLQTLRLIREIPAAVKPVEAINFNGFEKLKEKPEVDYILSSPASFNDSLDFKLEKGNLLRVTGKANGFTYTHRFPIGPIENLYIVNPPGQPYISILGLTPFIQNQSVLSVMDTLGNCIFQEKIEDYVSVLTASKDGRFLLLQKRTPEDSLIFYSAYRIR